jgi:hypothetical protein
MKTRSGIPPWLRLGEALAFLLALNSVAGYVALSRWPAGPEVRRTVGSTAHKVVLQAADYRDASEVRSVDAVAAAARIEGAKAAVEPLRRSMGINALGALGMLAVLAGIAFRLRPDDPGGDLE